ncbi:hypothetical protein L6452_18779 [Arctium lappa]|uniref:Uncharacterized protein n=1 Tax=Arctium lappa TaxID=4217 RepID=A0ACB9C764_ARCLA|nr:hypothetical protein L6452_18779 [Arctium lappa]
MPEIVITNVLDRLPLQEAVRTSILSRNWRFTWTLLSQLVFDYKFYRYLPRKKHGGHLFYKRNLGKLLLQLEGSITKFVLYMPAEEQRGKRNIEYCNTMYADIVKDINHWILFLSTKGIKEFTLINMRPAEPVKLPNHLFLCLGLKHLKLRNCCLHPVPGFHCFPKLVAFEFDQVTFNDRSCKYGEFITRCCPLLEILKFSFYTPNGEVKLGEIAKLVNLKSLSLWFCKLGDMVVTSSDIIQLVGSLPKLETLNVDFILAKAAGDGKRLSANLRRLKTLELIGIDLEDDIMVECACDLINGLPNLQTLKMIHVTPCFLLRGGGLLDYSKLVWSIKGNLQLQYVKFECFSGSQIELHFIKSLLAYSPLLKEMVIIEEMCGRRRHNNSCRELLKLHRASPIAELHFFLICKLNC